MRKIADIWTRFLGVFFITTILSLIMTDKAFASNGIARYIADELLIQSKAGVSKARIAGILRGLSADNVGEILALKIIRIRVPAHALEKVKTALAHNPNISFVENNYIAEIIIIPNDSEYSSQWHLPNISAPQGWNIGTGSDTVSIAIIDSGVDSSHPDLSGKLMPGYNFLDDNTRTRDVHGHGTKVAGTAAAISNNGIGVASVAWQNPIIPLVVVDKKGWALYSDIASAITYATDSGVKVMNISIAGSSYSYTLQSAVNYAWNNGAIVIAGAGNSSSSAPNYPAALDNVVAVSGTDSSDARASFSSYGDWIDISAPAVSIRTTSKGGGYTSSSGTSFSSPLTAGLAALILSANPNLTNAQVVDIMLQNADDLGNPGFDIYFGHGKVSVLNSLVAATSSVPDPDTTPPTAEITNPADGSTISGNITVNVSATDNAGVTEVALYIDGSLYATDKTNPYDFLWNTENYFDGDYELVAFSYDSSGNEGQSDPVMFYVNNQFPPPVYSLTVNKTGSGSGAVTSIPAGINCGTDCTEPYNSGTVVTLTAIPDADSTFGSWIDCINRAGNQCTETINGDTTVTVTFNNCINPFVKNTYTSEYYDYIQSAYDYAEEGDTIQSRAGYFAENLNFNRNILVIMEGGFDCGYAVITDITTINGEVVINNGSITIQRGMIEIL